MPNTSTIALASMTYAMKAQELLRAAGIGSQVVRVRPELTPGGCSYGLSVSRSDAQRALAIIRKTGMQHRLI
ncbi:MAG: DUF3343 domain-containing protein [Clostridia bacterium]|nr:DUF3343 domain-containing protein [Clostridia bacterium]